MAYYERNKAVSLFTSFLILGYFLWRMADIYQDGVLEPVAVFTVWGITIALTIAVNIVGVILAHIFGGIFHALRTRGGEPDFTEDERDHMIELRGDRVAHILFSLGVFVSMILFVYGQPAIVMFALIALAGQLSEIGADVYRLVIFRRGF